MEFVKTNLTEMTASNSLPDIIFANFIAMSDVRSLDIAEDLTPYIKKANVNLSRFEDYIFKQPNVFDNGKYFALPYYTNFSALYYNKDIFDKFGVPYPKDGMTWEDAIELGTKLTRIDGGAPYYGLGITPERVANSLPTLHIDGNTNQGTMKAESWKTVYALLNSNWSIPGMKNLTDTAFPNVESMFSKDRNIAMIPGQSYVLRGLKEPVASGFNFDIVQLPSHKSSSNTYEWDNTALLTVAKTSKLKDDAFNVISLIESDEYQTWITERGQLTALKNKDIKLKYGTAMDFLKGKNIAGIFKSHAAVPQPISKYYSQTLKYVNSAMNDAIYKGIDINEALRNADESINKDILTFRK